jgi:hypothetical protein
VLNATFSNISVISWRSVFLMEEIPDLSQVTDKLYHIMLCRTLTCNFHLLVKILISCNIIGLALAMIKHMCFITVCFTIILFHVCLHHFNINCNMTIH